MPTHAHPNPLHNRASPDASVDMSQKGMTAVGWYDVFRQDITSLGWPLHMWQEAEANPSESSIAGEKKALSQFLRSIAEYSNLLFLVSGWKRVIRLASLHQQSKAIYQLLSVLLLKGSRYLLPIEISLHVNG